MGTTAKEIREWVMEGKSAGATHVIIVCDTFDHEDYPVNVMPGQNVATTTAEYSGKNMQRVMEVYAMHLDLEAQLKEHRSYHVEPAPPRLVERMITESPTTALEHRIVAQTTKPQAKPHARPRKRKLEGKGQLPTKPTSSTWEKDARALLSMGAREVDAATVRGLLDELDEARKGRA